jgi:protein disulfide-isomerase
MSATNPRFRSVTLSKQAGVVARMAFNALTALTALTVVTAFIVSGCKGTSGLSDMPKLSPRPLKIPQVWHHSLDEGISESLATGKPMLVNFTGSDWCTWCVKLKKDVFETATFGEWAKDKVVLVSLDYPKRSTQPASTQQRNQEIAKQYRVESYPTNLFLDAGGNLIGKGPGYIDNPQGWIEQADQVLGVGKQGLANPGRTLD